MEILSTAAAAALERAAVVGRESRQDALTDLPNRAAFREAFEKAGALSARHGHPLSVAMIDVDHFKAVNDTWGHPTGDRALRQLGETLFASLRKSDMVARWGGEEFMALFPETSVREAEIALEKTLMAVRRITIPVTDHTLNITCSAGVTEVKPGTSLDEAVAEADRLLYLAKEAGRDRVVSMEHGMKPLKKKILLAEKDESEAMIIKHRLEREGFDVSHISNGVEALEVVSLGGVSLLILGIELPQIGGLEVLRRVRAMPGYSKIPVMMVASMGREEDIVRGFEWGADDYVVKPFSPTELVARLRRLLKRS